MTRKIYIIALLLFVSMTSRAQEKLRVDVSGDFVSSFIWRGLQLAEGSVQPSLSLNYRGLMLELWGSYELVSPATYKEIDITLCYNIGKFKLKLADYWSGDFASSEDRYFYYNAHSSAHLFEAGVGYDFGLLTVEWNTFFAGKDDVNNRGKREYSSYFEAEAPFRLAGLDWKGTLGVVPYASQAHCTTGFAVTRVSVRATKAIKITDTFDIPIFVDVTGNPCTQKAYFVFGFTLEP